MNRQARATLFAFSTLALAGCEKPAKISADATVVDGKVKIVVKKDVEKKGKLVFSGSAKAIDKLGKKDFDDDSIKLEARLKDFPVGTTKVSVAFEGGGLVKYKGSASFEVEREPDPVKLRFTPALADGLKVTCTSTFWCPKASTFYADADGYLPMKGTDDEGCSVELAGEEHAVEGKTWKLDAWPVLADAQASLATTKEKSLVLPLDAKCGDEAASKQDLKFNSIEIAIATFRGIAKRPLKAKKEKSTPGKNIAFVETYNMRFIGKVEKLRDVDYVAKIDSTRRVLGSCSYGDYSTGFELDKVTYDETVHVHDRRTGKELATKTFTGSWPSCPLSAKRSDGSVVGWPDEKIVDAWIQETIDKK